MGYELEQIEQMVTQLIGAGQANVNMLDRLTGAKATDIIVVPQEAAPYPPAGQLTRYENNPILAPIPEHYWESKYVLNCAALRIADKVYLFYRAFGDDEVSRIGLAVTDGYNVLERLPEPIFVPAEERRKRAVRIPAWSSSTTASTCFIPLMTGNSPGGGCLHKSGGFPGASF